MTRDYGPDETWPTHKKAYWRAPLEQARAAGWTLHYVDAPHTFGTAACPAGEHTFKIDGTATGAAFFAAEASKIVTRKCRHGAGTQAGKVRERVERGAELLERAEQLLDMAESKLSHIEVYQASWSIVGSLEAESDQLQMQIDTAELTLAEADCIADGAALHRDELTALEAELAVVEAQLESELTTADSLDEPPAADVVEESLEAARQQVGEAEDVAVALRRREGLAKPLAQRARRARARIDDLRARLAVVQER